MDYDAFLAKKTTLSGMHGFTPTYMSSALFPFQEALCTWAIEKGRAALFEDCGLGKSLQALVWAENVRRHTNKPVLILTPLAVVAQFTQEGTKFDIDCGMSRDGTVHQNITVTNYEQLHKFSPNDFAGVVCDESSILKHFTGATQKSVTRFPAQDQLPPALHGDGHAPNEVTSSSARRAKRSENSATPKCSLQIL